MNAKDKDKTKSPPPRPFVPRLAANTAFVRSPPAASPRLNSSPSSSPATRRPLSVPNGSSTPRLAAANERTNTPIKAVVAKNDNITPRSSARRSKLSSAHSTPRAAATADSQASPRLGADRESTTSSLGESFFHASDAPSQSPPRRPVPVKQTSSFIYANGSRDRTATASEKGSEHHSSISVDHRDHNTAVTSWFDKTISSPTTSNATPSPSKPNSTVSAPVSGHTFNSIEPRAPRAPSPTKQNFHLSYRKGASQVIRPEDSRQSFRALSPQQPSYPPADTKRRQSSLDTISEPTNGVQYNDNILARDSPSVSTYLSSPTPPLISDAQATSNSALPAKVAVSSDHASPRLRTTSISSQSLTGALASPPLDEERGGSQGDSQQSLAAKARQERKVLDLEISNSSLLAINRSLEREMRKQKAELRRFRRLSRNPNRSSWLSDATTSPMEYDEDDPYYDGIRGESDNEGDELDDLSDQESGSEEAMSPQALAEHDARHLVRDEARLRLDLAKHKELLVDSQKMNSSLRRCLGITEQLIKDGGKALEYQVNVADVQLGGRVLSPEELEMKPEWQEEADSYFMSKWSRESDRLSAASQRILAESDMGTDIDSGVDLEYGKRSREVSGRERSSTVTQAEAELEPL